MTPYLAETMLRCAAATSIQSAYRSHLCRVRLSPNIVNMVGRCSLKLVFASTE